MNERIDMKKIILTIRENTWILISIVSLMILSMFIYMNCFSIPVYQKNTQILVNQSEKSQANGVDSQTVQADLQLVSTYSTIISSPRILEKVQYNLEKKYSIQELVEMIKVKNTANSQIIDISVEDTSPQIASQIANLTARIFIEEVPKIMKIDNVTTLSKAQYLGNEIPVKPKKALLMLLAFFVGILFAFSFIFIKLLFERTFTSINELEEYLGIYVLGEVSVFQRKELFRSEKKRRR